MCVSCDVLCVFHVCFVCASCLFRMCFVCVSRVIRVCFACDPCVFRVCVLPMGLMCVSCVVFRVCLCCCFFVCASWQIFLFSSNCQNVFAACGSFYRLILNREGGCIKP